MKTYVLCVAGAVLLAAVVTVICPSGRMGKFVRGMGKLVILAVLLSPLPSLFGKGLFRFSDASVRTDAGYLRRCADLLEQRDAPAVEAYIMDTFGAQSAASTEREAKEGFALLKITVKITNDGINGQDGHINIVTRVKEALEERYACPAEVT